MFLAQRTRQRIKSFGIFIAVYALVIAIFAVFSLPKEGFHVEAYLRWFVGVPIVLAIWFVLEWAGTMFLALRFWQRMPSVVRITLLVIGIVAIVAVVLSTIQLIGADR